MRRVNTEIGVELYGFDDSPFPTVCIDRPAPAYYRVHSELRWSASGPRTPEQTEHFVACLLEAVAIARRFDAE